MINLINKVYDGVEGVFDRAEQFQKKHFAFCFITAWVVVILVVIFCR